VRRAVLRQERAVRAGIARTCRRARTGTSTASSSAERPATAGNTGTTIDPVVFAKAAILADAAGRIITGIASVSAVVQQTGLATAATAPGDDQQVARGIPTLTDPIDRDIEPIYRDIGDSHDGRIAPNAVAGRGASQSLVVLIGSLVFGTG
jgi:hypothetical protein